MIIYHNTTVGEVAAGMPGALQAFNEFQVDFCCGGKKPLAEALAEKNVRVEDFFARADAFAAERRAGTEENDFMGMSPTVLSYYIEDTHHTYLRRMLPETEDLFQSVLKAHGRSHPELFEVYKLFGQLKTELIRHLIKEETDLFPAFSEDSTPEKALAAEIVAEHEAAGELLAGMRKASFDYKIPDDACPTYRRVYELLEEMESDLHQHIHLENNILLRGLVA